MFWRSCLVWLLALAASAASTRRNATARGRAFTHWSPDYSDSIPGEFPANAETSNDSWTPNTTVSPVSRLSEEALVFLTSPVSTILMPSFYSLVCLISLPINLFAIVAFSHRISPKKPAAIYMLNLACADFLFALLLPFRVFYHFNGNDWIFGPIACRVITAAFYWNMYCSVLLVSCISVDRLLAVVYPIDSLAWRRPKRAVMACVAMWMVSLGSAAPLVFSEQTAYLAQLNITTCHDVQNLADHNSYYKIYFIVVFCALFFLPFLVTLVSYSRVIYSLSRVPPGVPGRSRRKTRALVMTLTVLVMFILCFLPTNCLLLLHYAQFNDGIQRIQDVPDGSYAAYLIFLCLGSLNCALDPLVYYFGSSQCQRQMTRMVKCVKADGDGSSSSAQSSSGSYKQSRTTVKSRCSSSLSPSERKKEALQGNSSGLYKKLLV
ncbi:proteinase-activated receptor 1-like [Synchiropus splendidus]|uniref:proteinase-activated receptor 1-like n=1 Tax=Synchiropus splendidus TaxID=270530 RepID=UPI00237D55B7|nr:proteinase-activated receptor 1-like [Synchiropus splendidus]